MPCCLRQATDPCVMRGCSQPLYSCTLITQPKHTWTGMQAGGQTGDPAIQTHLLQMLGQMSSSGAAPTSPCQRLRRLCSCYMMNRRHTCSRGRRCPYFSFVVLKLGLWVWPQSRRWVWVREVAARADRCPDADRVLACRHVLLYTAHQLLNMQWLELDSE